jgi:Domain of unknown function (DUF4174)
MALRKLLSDAEAVQQGNCPRKNGRPGIMNYELPERLRQLSPMKLFVLLVLAAVAAAFSARAQTPRPASLAATVQGSKWQQRVVLLCAPTPENADLRRQLQLLEPVGAELEARDMLVRAVVFSQLPAADQRYARERLHVSGKGFVLLLIGKDGGVKRRETAPLPPAQLFSTIDAMPMRRQEMRRQ